MKITELRKLMARLDRTQEDQILLHLAKTLPKGYKELVGLAVQETLDNKPLFGKDAFVPDTAKIRKWLDKTEESIMSCPWKYKYRNRRKLEKKIKDVQKELFRCPAGCEVTAESLNLLRDLFLFCIWLQTHIFFDRFLNHENNLDFFRKWLALCFGDGYSKDALRTALVFCIKCSVQQALLGYDLTSLLLANLRNGDLRNECIDILEGLIHQPEVPSDIQTAIDFVLLMILDQELGPKEADAFAASLDPAQSRHARTLLNLITEDKSKTESQDLTDFIETD